MRKCLLQELHFPMKNGSLNPFFLEKMSVTGTTDHHTTTVVKMSTATICMTKVINFVHRYISLDIFGLIWIAFRFENYGENLDLTMVDK